MSHHPQTLGWWPVILAFFLAFTFWWGGVFEVRVARADTLPLCEAGQEYDAGLCYPQCNDGFDGIGPVCWERCPDGYTDDGALCRRDAIIIAKESYGRGVGTPLVPSCGGDELDAGLCYPQCNAGFDGVGPVCWQICPSGYEDHGLTCYKNIFDFFPKASYGRGVGYIPGYGCSAGQEEDAGLCYDPCEAGFDGVGPVCWQQCPADYTDDGAFCRKDAHIFAKNSYGRGVGTIPNCDINNLDCAGNFEVSNNFRPIPNGYHFDNWGKSTTQYNDATDFDTATLLRMFGSTVCQSGSTAQDCVLTAATRQWREAQLAIWQGGHCYGMATSSQLFFAGLDLPGTYQPGAGTTYALDPISAVRAHITEMAATQYLEPADGSGSGWIRTGKPSEMLNLIRTQLQTQPNDPYVLGIHKQGGGGHAVTPYAIENRGDNVYWLHVYDNNWSNKDRYIVFDTVKETWLYNFGAANPAEPADAWRGDATTDSLNLRLTSAHKLSGWTCPFCRQTITASGVRAMDKVEFTLIGEGRLLVIDGQNQAIGWDFNADQFVNQIAGAERIEFLGGGAEVNPLLRLPLQPAATPYTVYASGDALTQTVTADLLMVGPGYTVGVDGIVLGPQQNLRMTMRPDGRQISFNASDSGSFTPTLFLASDADPAGNGYIFDVGGVQLTPAKSVTVTLDLEHQTLHFADDDSDADAYDMALLRITPSGEEQTYRTTDVALEGTDPGAMNFGAWDGSGAMNFTLDGQTQTLDNEAVQTTKVFLPLVSQ